ncbi:hypothetical protein HY57_05175 [Dyella japonica A8]|uniref:HTH araC/xylS-type domain-containing protein n=2 Tax=Dyella japonica TaxID=231455 RepID=A0A075JX66_9GAMM|nr:hypothetical protein HY57_05175 [Dyella japonica A8]
MVRLLGLAFDAFEEAMRGVSGRYVPLKRNTDEWGMQYIVLADIEVMLGHNGGGSIYEGACQPENFGLFFPLSRTGDVILNGQPMGQRTIAWLVPDRHFHCYNSDVLRWVGISVGCGTVRHWLNDLAEDFRPGPGEHLVGQSMPSLVAGLGDLVCRIFRVSDVAPEALEDMSARRTLYEQLVSGIYDAVQAVEPLPSTAHGRPRLARKEIIRRALDLLDMEMSETLLVTDLSQAAGVSSRTLQTAFLEHFGLTPHRFLMLRRLRAIHEALQSAGQTETVAQICGRFGVWDFGRFSRSYKHIYGELPSKVLSRGRPAVPA